MRFAKLVIVVITTVFSAAAFSATQTKPLKVGLILSMTGPFAGAGHQVLRGVKLYMSEHGDTVAGRKIELVVKDDTGINPSLAKREALDLITHDNVAILGGFDLSPNAFSVAPLATKAKVPMIVMNAATSSITEKSPYIVRTSMAMPQSAWAIAKWAHDNGIKTVYTLVADYAPGHDVEAQFKKTFTQLGGKIVGSVNTPVDTHDYSPYLQRVKSEDPDALFMFVPSGSTSVSLVKGFRNLDMGKAGIKLLATGDVTESTSLPAIGDAAIGIITAFHYSPVHQSPENKAFVEAYKKAYPKYRPHFMAVAGYDGMHVIYQALKKNAGKVDAKPFVSAIEGMSWQSPRGPVTIDAQTRDIDQNEYIRKVERVDGELHNVEFAVYDNVTDPEKAEAGDLSDIQLQQLNP